MPLKFQAVSLSTNAIPNSLSSKTPGASCSAMVSVVLRSSVESQQTKPTHALFTKTVRVLAANSPVAVKIAWMPAGGWGCLYEPPTRPTRFSQPRLTHVSHI